MIWGDIKMREVTQDDIDAAAKRTLDLLEKPRKFFETAAFLGIMGEIFLTAAAFLAANAIKNVFPLFIVMALSAVMWIWIFRHKDKMMKRIGLENARMIGLSEEQFNELTECRDINDALQSELYSDKVMELYEEKLSKSCGYIRIYCLCNLISGCIQRLDEDRLQQKIGELDAVTPQNNMEERDRANALFYYYAFKKKYPELISFFEDNELLFSQGANSSFDMIYSFMSKLGEYYFALKEYEKALSYFEKCFIYEENKVKVREMKNAPENKTEQLNMGAFAVNCAQCSIETGDLEAAEKYLDKARPVHMLTAHLSRAFSETEDKFIGLKESGEMK